MTTKKCETCRYCKGIREVDPYMPRMVLCSMQDDERSTMAPGGYCVHWAGRVEGYPSTNENHRKAREDDINAAFFLED